MFHLSEFELTHQQRWPHYISQFGPDFNTERRDMKA